MADELINLITYGTLHSYACPNVSTHAIRFGRASLSQAGCVHQEKPKARLPWSRASTSSDALGLDPIELRVKNHAHVHPDSGLPWSSNASLKRHRQGAERFGWSARTAQPRSMRNQGQLVGFGMARGALFAYQPPCQAIASVRRDGTAFMRSGATDIGPGPYTVMTMLAADCLGVPIERVRFGLGDSDMPRASQEGGSGLTGALGNAVQASCVDLVRAFVNLVSDDGASPVKGCRLEGITVRDGGMQITYDPVRFETYADILTRHGLDELTIEGESAPPGETSSATMIVQAGRFIPYTAPSTGTAPMRVDTPPTSSRSTSTRISVRCASLASCRPSMVAGFSTRRRHAVRSSEVSPWALAWHCWRKPCRIYSPSGDHVAGRVRRRRQRGRGAVMSKRPVRRQTREPR